MDVFCTGRDMVIWPDRMKTVKGCVNVICKYIWVGRHCRGIKVQSGNGRKVFDHESCEVELAQFMDEIIKQSYLWQQEFSLGDLGVSFHCNDTSNLSTSIASLSAKEGKHNCEEKRWKKMLVCIMTYMGSMAVVLIIWVYNYYIWLIIRQDLWGLCNFKTPFFSCNSSVAYGIIFLWLEMKTEMSQENN